MTIDMCEPDEGWMSGLSAEGREKADTVAWQKSRHDLAGLVSAWVASARRIATGGDGKDYYDDYHVYVSWRESIDEVIAALSAADASIVLRAVEPADTQFKNYTFDDGGQAMSRKHKVRTECWYWRRVPMRGPIARSLGIDETR